MFRCTLVKTVAVALATLVTACIAPPSLAQSGQAFPARPIKIVVAFAAGGSSDVLARVLAQQFAAITGATVIVENKPGASGAIAMEAVARATPDGYTLLWASDSTVVQPLLRNLTTFMKQLKDPTQYIPTSGHRWVKNLKPISAKKPLRVSRWSHR